MRSQQKGAQTLPEKISDEQMLEIEQVGRGDIIEVKVFMEPEMSGVYPIGYDGAIRFPMIGKVAVVSRDVQSVADDIRERLKTGGILVDPQIAVSVRERTAQKIHVLGEVEKAGTFGFRTGMTVIEAITNAGGFTKLASQDGVKVTRVSGEEFKVAAGSIVNGKAPNLPLEPGDIIYVPQSVF